MNRSSRGFGLIELMIAMTLGLLVVAGTLQIFISAKSTYQSQSSAAGIQEDARYLLSKMVQEIRMVGMFGCLATVTDRSTNADFQARFDSPIAFTRTSTTSVLTLTTADVGGNGSNPNWNIVTDCRSSATAYSPANTPAATSLMASQFIMPIRQVIYTYANNQIITGSTTANQAVLVNNVTGFDISFGIAASAGSAVVASYVATPTDTSLIRSIRISLTIAAADSKAKSQIFNVVASVRNRLL
jgi:type IV pilus assembly protein PilW